MVVYEDTHGNRGLTKSGLTESEADAILARFALASSGLAVLAPITPPKPRN